MFVGIIARNADRMHRLVEDLLDLSRIESREYKLQLEAIDLHSAAAQTFELFRERADKKAIAAYWESLTPEQQAELDAGANAAADPEMMAMEDGPLKRIGQRLRRDGYIRQLLRNREPVPSEA